MGWHTNKPGMSQMAARGSVCLFHNGEDLFSSGSNLLFLSSLWRCILFFLDICFLQRFCCFINLFLVMKSSIVSYLCVSVGALLWCRLKYLNNYWMDYCGILLRQPLCPQDEAKWLWSSQDLSSNTTMELKCLFFGVSCLKFSSSTIIRSKCLLSNMLVYN